jgi:hypothetical protein
MGRLPNNGHICCPISVPGTRFFGTQTTQTKPTFMIMAHGRKYYQ